MLELSKLHVKWGCTQLHRQLRHEGHNINHKRTARLYRKHALKLRRRRRRKLPERVRQPLVQTVRPNQCWSVDFMSDSLASGRAYRTFNVLDDYAREALAIEIDISLTANRVIRVLDQLCETYGNPEAIRSDNGPEFRSESVQTWAKERSPTCQRMTQQSPSAFVYKLWAALLGYIHDHHDTSHRRGSTRSTA